MFGDLNKSLLENVAFFEKHCGSGSSSELLTPSGSPSKSAQFKLKGKNLQNTRPSRFNLPLRGGKIYVVCENHRNEPEFCCLNKKLDSQKMLMCEFCLMWYHAKCEQVSGSDIAGLENYKCTNCVDWSQKYDSIFKPALEKFESPEILVPADAGDDFRERASWNRSILPKRASYILTMEDHILIAAVW